MDGEVLKHGKIRLSLKPLKAYNVKFPKTVVDNLEPACHAAADEIPKEYLVLVREGRAAYILDEFKGTGVVSGQGCELYG